MELKHSRIKSKSFLFPFFLLCVLLVTEAPFVFGLFQTVQEKITDRLFLQKTGSGKIVVIAIDDASIADIGQWPWPRTAFATILDQLISDPLNKPVSVGIDVSFSEPSRVGSDDDVRLSEALERARAAGVSVVLPIDLASNTNRVLSEPFPLFKERTQQGFINIPLDGDGVARYSDWSRSGTMTESFSHALAPVAAPNPFRIDYRGTNGFSVIPFLDVAIGQIPSRIFKDKIVLIGATAPNLHDDVATPFNKMAGVFVNANAINTLLAGKFFTSLDRAIAFVLIGLIAAFVSLIVRRIKKLIPLLFSLVAVLVAIVVATSVAFGFYLLLPIFYFFLAFVLSLIASLAFHYITESKEKEFIRKSFQYYLTPHVIDEILKHPEKLSLGGESRHMTILFSDIRGFTTISESLTPEELTHLLNEYLTAMTDIIMEHGGVVDKYIGDAIMAFWGAPLDDANQESEACMSSVLMMQKLAELNKTWKTPLAIGIGMNSGNVVVGNMGSHKRFNYTVMGDEVNLASRLESLTKYYRVSVLVSESTYRAIGSESGFYFRELDLVVVKGKKEPTKLFELLVEKPSATDDQALVYFQAGRALYKKGQWDSAIAKFKKAIALNNDGPSQLFIERCEKFRVHPPQNWNGVYVFENK